MKRIAILMILFGVSSASLAAEPAFCKSMCASEKSTCRAKDPARATDEGGLLVDMPDKNPVARAARVQLRSDDGGALAQSGYQHRRIERAGACDETYLRCTRACDAPAADAVVARRPSGKER